MTVTSGQSEGTVEVTPSGIPVYYQSKPKRCYRIGLLDVRKHGAYHQPDNETLLESAQSETWGTMWREVPSVTTVLGVLDKPALPWWGMKTGIEGVRTLYSKGLIRDYGNVGIGGDEYTPNIYDLDTDGIVELLTKHKLTVNHVRDKAGDRGQAVHDAFEMWARTGSKPDPQVYPDEERGYVEGLCAFLADVPSIEPIAAEVLVASAEHGFAGRYDIRFRTWQPHDVVVHRTPKRGATYRRLAPGLYLGDLKTSKGVYASHARQLEAYEQASTESGYEPTEARGILHVAADGTYEFVRSWATFEDFRVVLAVWQSDQQMKERK